MLISSQNTNACVKHCPEKTHNVSGVCVTCPDDFCPKGNKNQILEIDSHPVRTSENFMVFRKNKDSRLLSN